MTVSFVSACALIIQKTLYSYLLMVTLFTNLTLRCLSVVFLKLLYILESLSLSFSSNLKNFKLIFISVPCVHLKTVYSLLNKKKSIFIRSILLTL